MKPSLEISVSTTSIKHNFDTVGKQLDALLEDFRGLVVTTENIGDSRKQATELNKVKKQIAERRRAVATEAMAPIKAFEVAAKELEQRVEDVRQEITSQLSRFEAERLQKVNDLLVSTLNQLQDAREVSPDFRTVDISDLRKLGSMTAGGNLTSAVTSTLEARVMDCYQTQEQVKFRLNALRTLCDVAGLAEPIPRERVERHLRTSSADEYDSIINDMVQEELNRQKNIEKAVQQQIETPPAEPVKIENVPVPKSSPAPAGRKKVAVTISLLVEVPVTVPDVIVERQLKERLQKAGVSQSIQSIEVKS
jgi:DNA anti-recombination protein RmuC